MRRGLHAELARKVARELMAKDALAAHARDELGISEHTVKFHVNSILTRLDVASRAEAVAVGMRRGLILL